MKQIYFTVTGIKFRYGADFYAAGFLRPGQPVRLVKEPENEYDSDAIRVEMDGLGQIGYVANSVHTVLGESKSAGRIYDRIGKKAVGTILYVTPRGVICALEPKKKKQ